MSYPDFEECNTCAGTGEGLYGPIGSSTCLSCGGSGTRNSDEAIQRYEDHQEMMMNMMREEQDGPER